MMKESLKCYNVHGLIIDEEANTVRKSHDPAFCAELLYTQVGSFRNQDGLRIGTEILHVCRMASGDEFVLDESLLDELDDELD